jgi:hypothetical protein
MANADRVHARAQRRIFNGSRGVFCELHVAKSSKVATEVVEAMARLWEIEETIRGQSPEAPVAPRQERSAAVVRDPLHFGRLPCRVFQKNPNSPRHFAMPHRVAMYSLSPAATAGAGHGRLSLHCSKRQR